MLACGDVTTELDVQGVQDEGISVECDSVAELIGNGGETIFVLPKLEVMCGSECSDAKKEMSVDGKMDQPNLAQLEALV